MEDRVYQCKKCGERGAIDHENFIVKFYGKASIRKIKHSADKGDCVWLKGEVIYKQHDNPFLDRVREKYGVSMRDMVIVRGLEDQLELQITGIKSGTRNKIILDVWNPETKATFRARPADIKQNLGQPVKS